MEIANNGRGRTQVSLTEGNREKVLTRAPSSTVSVSPTLATGSALGSTSLSANTSCSEATLRYLPQCHSTADRNTARATTPPKAVVHPFANTAAKLELMPSSTNADGINIEEEARLYDELCGSYENATDAFSRSNTPLRTAPAPSKLVKHNSQPPPNTTQRRRPRSLPPESVFSADIFLADNTGRTPIGASPLFAQDVRIAGWSTVGDGGGKFGFGSGSTKSVGSGGAYVVYDCVITTREATTMHVLKRYSAFEELRSALKRTLPSSLLPFVPALPPKAALARFRPAFLDSRRKHLQFFLASVLLHPEIGGREVVRRWVLS